MERKAFSPDIFETIIFFVDTCFSSFIFTHLLMKGIPFSGVHKGSFKADLWSAMQDQPQHIR